MKVFTITKTQSSGFLLLILLLAIFIVPATKNTSAQDAGKYNLDELKGLFEAHARSKYQFAKPAANQTGNEMHFITNAGFRFYKLFLSSQDNPSCIFYPSCSEYSIQAFQQKGLFLGIFYTFDRLSRCHRLVKKGEYFYDESKQRFYDPLL